MEESREAVYMLQSKYRYWSWTVLSHGVTVETQVLDLDCVVSSGVFGKYVFRTPQARRYDP